MSTEDQEQFLELFKKSPRDTGSTSYQIAALTLRMDEIGAHLRKHPKDHASRRGLLQNNGQRRRLMRYLENENPEEFSEVKKKLRERKRS